MFALAMATLVAAAASGCSSDGEAGAATVTHAAGTSGMGTMTMPAGTTMPPASTLASTPATGAGGRGVYAHTGAGDLSPKVAGQRSLVYVPNSDGDSVTVIDPKTFKVIDEFTTGAKPQHVVPSWDLSTLYATNNTGNSLTPIDPVTGRVKGSNIPVADPYNIRVPSKSLFADQADDLEDAFGLAGGGSQGFGDASVSGEA